MTYYLNPIYNVLHNFLDSNSKVYCFNSGKGVFQKYAKLGLPISPRSLLLCTYFIKETNKKVAKIRKKNGVKKKKKPPIKKLIKSDQNCDELGNIYDHMRDFFKFESSNVKENGKIENIFSCLSCLGSGGLWRF